MQTTPQRPVPFSHPVSSPPLSPTALPFGPANPANETRRSVCLAVLHRLYASYSTSLALFNPTAASVFSTVFVCPCPSRPRAPVFWAFVSFI
eukprot:6776461-Pyramimonas_sp.AAC.1